MQQRSSTTIYQNTSTKRSARAGRHSNRPEYSKDRTWKHFLPRAGTRTSYTAVVRRLRRNLKKKMREGGGRSRGAYPKTQKKFQHHTDPTSWYHHILLKSGGTKPFYRNMYRMFIIPEYTRNGQVHLIDGCLLYTSPSPRDS